MVYKPNLAEERALWDLGYELVAGLDEAGRGAWAGPVVAAAVIFPQFPEIPPALADVRDSKLLNPRQRERCYEAICRLALAWGVGQSSVEEIDTYGIAPATRLAMMRAVAGLSFLPRFLLIDAMRLEMLNLPQRSLIKGDRQCLSIAAASILAKVTRDREMIALDAALPQYGFARHKGYGTPQHRAALRTWGPSPEHRRSFAPLRLRLFTNDRPHHTSG
ncbi:MAG: ribonuclease HII, partial [Chloroflexi bacterium]|nr:ribonuclease HII [Chloroflexota bacterium]